MNKKYKYKIMTKPPISMAMKTEKYRLLEMVQVIALNNAGNVNKLINKTYSALVFIAFEIVKALFTSNGCRQSIS